MVEHGPGEDRQRKEESLPPPPFRQMNPQSDRQGDKPAPDPMPGGEGLMAFKGAGKQGEYPPILLSVGQQFRQETKQPASGIRRHPTPQHLLHKVKPDPDRRTGQQIVGQAEGLGTPGPQEEEKEREQLHRLLDEGPQHLTAPVRPHGKGSLSKQAMSEVDDQG